MCTCLHLIYTHFIIAFYGHNLHEYILYVNHRKQAEMVPGMTGAMEMKNVNSNNTGRDRDVEGPVSAQPGSSRHSEVQNADIKSHHMSIASASNLSDNDVVKDIEYVLGDVEGGEGAVSGKSHVTWFDQYHNSNLNNDSNNEIDQIENKNENENDPTAVEQSNSSSHHSDSEILYNNNDSTNQTENHGTTSDGINTSKGVARAKGKTRGNTRGKRTSAGTRKGTNDVNGKNIQTVVDMEENKHELDSVNDMDDVDVEEMYGDENNVDETNGKTVQE